MITSRGCPFRCSFCSVSPIWDFQPYLRPAEDIVAEIKFLLERGRTNVFLFQDEYFLASPQRAKEFSRMLIEADLRGALEGLREDQPDRPAKPWS